MSPRKRGQVRGAERSRWKVPPGAWRCGVAVVRRGGSETLLRLSGSGNTGLLAAPLPEPGC